MKVVSARADVLRGLKLNDGRRALCVIDDTEDGENSTHPAHAALTSCREKIPADVEAPEITQIYEAVKNLYEDAVLWPKAA